MCFPTFDRRWKGAQDSLAAAVPFVLSATRQRRTHLVNSLTGKEIAKLITSADDRSLTQISFSPNGKLLAIASTKGVTVVDVGARKELFTCRKERRPIKGRFCGFGCIDLRALP